MTIYWLMMFVPLLAGISPWKAKGALGNIQWLFYGVLLIVIVGLRHEIGADWCNYILDFEYDPGTFSSFISGRNNAGDIGYDFIVWCSKSYLNGSKSNLDGIYATNLICAIIFIAGLIRFCKNTPIPWLALVVSIPYLVIVVGMGYTRQAVALGFIMWGLVDLMYGRKWSFYMIVLFGALFHKTAIIMLPVGFLSGTNRFKDYIVSLPLFALAFFALLIERFSVLMEYYGGNTNMQSSGAFIRVFMNVSAGLIFMIFRNKWAKLYKDNSLWLIFSIVSFIMLPLTFVSSTMIDRVALYFIPMQLVIYSKTPALINSKYNRTLYILCILFLYVGAMYIWLNFGQFSMLWLPYKTFIIK